MPSAPDITAPPAAVVAEVAQLDAALDEVVPAKASGGNIIVGTWNLRAFSDLTKDWAGTRSCAFLLICTGVALVFGLMSLSGASATSTRSAPSFAHPAIYAVGPGPASVAIADLSGDGKSDLVTANYWNEKVDTVSVLLNRGDGSFRTRREYPTGKGPYSVAIGDVNNDGKSDVVTANRAANTVSILVNKGHDGFQTHLDYPTGRGPSDVAIGDLNGDGKPDIVTANSQGNTVSVLLNQGDGSFQPSLGFRTAPSPQSVAIGDLNGDRKPDVAVATWANDFVSVFVNSGDGTLEPRVDYRAGSGPRSIAIDDLNGDRKPDLVTANHNVGPGDSVSVLLSRGHGSFIPKRNYQLGTSGAYSVAVGDLNRDGKLDIATAPLDGYMNPVLVNRGNGSFRARFDYPTHLGDGGETPRMLAIGELNGDRRLDLVTVGSAALSVLLASSKLPCIPPNVRGMTVAGAKLAIVRARCRVGKTDGIEDFIIPKGRVMWGDPKPPTVLPNRGSVDLVVSLGPKG